MLPTSFGQTMIMMITLPLPLSNNHGSIAHEAEAPKLHHTLNARCGAVSQDRDYAKDSLSRPIRSSPEGLEEK